MEPKSSSFMQKPRSRDLMRQRIPLSVCLCSAFLNLSPSVVFSRSLSGFITPLIIAIKETLTDYTQM